MANNKIEPYDRIYRSKKTMLFNNFISGIAWGLGTTLGVAIVLTILGFISEQIKLVPFIGDFVTQITRYVQAHQ